MNRILLIPRLRIHNANALSSPYTIGFPALTAWLGGVHALQRKLNADGLPQLSFRARRLPATASIYRPTNMPAIICIPLSVLATRSIKRRAPVVHRRSPLPPRRQSGDRNSRHRQSQRRRISGRRQSASTQTEMGRRRRPRL